MKNIFFIIMLCSILGCSNTENKREEIRKTHDYVGMYVDNCGRGGCLLGELYYKDGKFEDIRLGLIYNRRYDLESSKDVKKEYLKKLKGGE